MTLPVFVQKVRDCLNFSPGQADGYPPGSARLKQIATLTGLKVNSVSCAVERFSSDSGAYISANPDLFYSVYGKGHGVWGLRSLKLRESHQQVWVEGHWRDLPGDLEALAMPETNRSFKLMQRQAEEASKGDPLIGIRVSLFRK